MASANGISDRSRLSSPLVEDEYGDIFRNFTRGRKVPPVPFLDFSTDFGGGIAEISGDSYSDIFGGFGWDVAVSLEELLGGLIDGAGKKGAEKKVRGNGEKMSLENVPSRPHNFSVEEKLFSSENISRASTSASEQLHDEKPLTRSYKMTDIPGRENCMNKIHAAEVVPVSRYISDIDANSCSLVNHHRDVQDAIAYNTCTVSNVSEEVREIRPTITIMDDSSSRCYLPHMHRNDGKQDSVNIATKSHHVEYAPCINSLSYSFDAHGIGEPDSREVLLTVAEINLQTQPHHVEYASSTCINSLSYSFHETGIDEPDPSEAFLTVAEINLQTQPTQLPPPSRPPPKLDTKRDGKKYSSTNNWHENHHLHNLANSNSGYYRMTSSEASIDEVSLKPCLLPCLDVEMDANSAASASTCAPKEDMDQTSTNTKIAREFNEKRRDILDNQKILEARDGKRGVERKKGEAGQEFFTYTPKMAPREMKHYGQENWQAKTNPPLEVLDLHQGHRIFYPAHGYDENSSKGSSMVVGFDWQKMNISLDNGDQGEDHKGMMRAEENFVHQEGEMGLFLAHTYREKLLGEGLKGVKGMWGMEKREYKLDETQRWHVEEKTQNPAVVMYEMNESGNKLMTVQKVQQEEENIGKRKTYEQCTMAGQEIKQQGEKGKEKSSRQWKSSKEIQSFAAAWGADTQKEQEHILKTVQEIGKQDQVQNSRQILANNPAEQEEEAARLRMDETTYWHEKGDKVFEEFQDVNEATSKTQNAAKVISKQATHYRKKGMAQRAMDENPRSTAQIRYFTEAHEREQKEKMHLDKWRQEMEAEKEMDELWRLEEEMEKLRRLEKEVEGARGKGRDTVELETQNTNDKVIVEVFSSVELAAVDREISKVPETANAETCKTAEDVQAESWKKSQEEKSSRGPMLGMVQATRYGALGKEQLVNDIIREATAESAESMKQAVSEMVASLVGDEQKRNGEPELCNGTSLSVNTERHNPMSEVQNFSYDVSFEVEIEKRQKARLESYKRTEDRMARALAEMKARDILAEKEQAERNRLAEVLDCDIKRWSHGKEGNLRALLSTLQYILWPESGWNPVPLTEVITSAAVKKTYKKATLCLHPDKVQQKGASIQQKYISEKVFDLLKEAWNNFNSEER